jgi:tetratricopeptide (TPR) repeat protein
MTTTLTHPEAEDLGRFIEGTLDAPSRTAVVEHVADCDDCRIIVVDASEFFAKEHPVLQTADDRVAAFDVADARVAANGNGRWWMAAAAAIAITAGGVWLVDARSDPLAPSKQKSAGLPSRPVEARLNGFPYVAVHINRGGGEQETDSATLQLESEVQKVLERQGSSAKTLHALGVAHLLAAGLKKVDSQASDAERQNDAAEIKSERANALEALRAAVAAAPDNAEYRSDLAAALIATGDYKQAFTVSEQALQIDHGFQDALFNRAIAQSKLDRKKGIDAFKLYLTVDPKSEWAEEARRNIENLQ